MWFFSPPLTRSPFLDRLPSLYPPGLLSAPVLLPVSRKFKSSSSLTASPPPTTNFHISRCQAWCVCLKPSEIICNPPLSDLMVLWLIWIVVQTNLCWSTFLAKRGVLRSRLRTFDWETSVSWNCSMSTKRRFRCHHFLLQVQGKISVGYSCNNLKFIGNYDFPQ